jgi:hypothetical protein
MHENAECESVEQQRIFGLARLVPVKSVLPKLFRACARVSDEDLALIADLLSLHRPTQVNHCSRGVPESEIGKEFKHSTAWVLQGARPLRKPVPYPHPAGAVIWVNLDPEVTARVEQQLVVG